MREKILVLGAGLQGSACAYDLAVREGFGVTLADLRPEVLDSALTPLRAAGAEVEGVLLDTRRREAVRERMAEHRAVVSAVPWFLNLDLAEDAIEAGVHFTDMGGNTDLVLRQLELDARARDRGISIVPDMGLAPGMANLLAAHAMTSFEEVEEVRIRVGGLPRRPQPPLDYMLLFSMHGLINEYVGEALVLEEGEPRHVRTFADVERLHVDGVGELEAFPTLGGLSTLPYTYAGRVRSMDYRTIRYPGHFEKMRCLIDLGLLDEQEVEVGGVRVRPRDVFAACAGPRLDHPGEPDVTVVVVRVRGRRAGAASELALQIVDDPDPRTGHSSMQRTTAYPVAIVSAMQARGEIAAGAAPPERCVPLDSFVERLAPRAVRVQRLG